MMQCIMEPILVVTGGGGLVAHPVRRSNFSVWSYGLIVRQRSESTQQHGNDITSCKLEEIAF